MFVGQDRLDQLLAHRVERVERGQRVLEDHADPLAAHPAHVFGWEVVDALAIEPDLAAGDAAGGLEQADDGGAGHRLARAGFADDAENFAFVDLEGDVVDGDQRAAAIRRIRPAGS
jgi:glycine/D-amino acid oxidase-like deaminating enzyme